MIPLKQSTNQITFFKTLVGFIFVLSFSTSIFAQKVETKNATLVSRSTAMRYVPSLASRDFLIPAEDQDEEVQDARSKRVFPHVEGQQTDEDGLVNNPKSYSQSRASRAPSLVFDAYSSSSQPTDPSGAVGPNHYVSVFNTGYRIFDKSGNPLTGQLSPNNIFSSGGCCDLTVSYDAAADRWVMSYLYVGNGAEVAVSDGPNPMTAGWYVYSMPAISDYQKLSVWSDGYYMTDNTSATNKIYALERDEMLVGNASAQIIGFPLPGIVTSGFFSPQAFNVSNNDMPAAGSLPIVYMQDNVWTGVADHIKLWELDVDWVNSTGTISATPQQISTASFNAVFDSGGFSNLPQPGGGADLDALQATIMNQAQFRRFPTHNSAVFNFVVDTQTGSGKLAGIRWIELRQNGDGQPWSLYQEGTYNAPNGKHAWCASIIMDNQGNIGMGYTGMGGPSTSGTVHASSYYTGRMDGDPLGTMTVAEELIASGTGSVPGSAGRYGDYSKIDVDPSDDSTFWFVTEYNGNGRKGVVGVFKLAADTPSIGFDSPTGNTIENTDCSFTDINVPLSIGLAPSANADVTFTINSSSTATSGYDFDLQTPTITFPAGSTASQNMVLRIYHDGFVESDETIVVDFTVNANGGDAIADTNADTFTFTITDDDVVPSSSQNVTIYSEDFEDGVFDGTTAGNAGSDKWIIGDTASSTSSFWNMTGNNTNFDYTNDDACNCDKANDRLTTSAFSLAGSYSSATLTFDHAFANVSAEVGDVLVSTGGSFNSVLTLSNTSTSNGGGSYTTPWVNGVTIDMTPYLGQANVRVRFRYNDGGNWAYGMAVDNITVTAMGSSDVQTAVNTASSDLIDLNGPGTIYTADAISNNVMLDITNNNAYDYGCLDVSVSRAGTGAQAYGGSVAPDLAMDKTFSVTPTNATSSGDVSVLFYFTEAEIAGWEAATGLTRNDLVAAREDAGVITETAALTIGSFGSNVTLTGTFTGLSDTFLFGTANTFMSCTTTTTYASGFWDHGAPTLNVNAIISDNYNTSIANIEACSLVVNSGFTLTVGAGEYVHVTNDITVNGTLDVQHEGSVVQSNDLATVTNNGTIFVRKTTPTLDAPGFMILGNPMTSETREGVYNSAARVLHHITGNFVPNGAVGSGTENFADDNNNNWALHSGALTAAEGYLVKPFFSGSPSSTYSMDYTQGTLNNGVITYNLLYNGTRESSANMLGNPYASAIDNDAFLAANPLLDAIYYWQHITAPVQNFPGFNQLNYNLGDLSAYNQGSGGVAAANGGGIPTQFMASGQGFAVKALGAGPVTFNNSMRVTGPNTDYRNSENIPNSYRDRQRIWLDLKNETYGLYSNMLIAFTQNATNGFENKYDTKRFDTPISLYTVLEEGEELAIQGRTAFNIDQEVALGFNTQIQEAQNYSISINQLEGVDIENTDVYLEDRLLHVITNLSEKDYTFTANAGKQNNRFVLVFKERFLGENEFAIKNINIHPNPSSGLFTISSLTATINKVEVIDLRGRLMPVTIHTTTNDFVIDMKNLENAMYFVKLHTSEGIFTKRVMKE
ncbi:MAG: T9SS type A sorting domain-containing protein [Flavobacteriales bacterium]